MNFMPKGSFKGLIQMIFNEPHRGRTFQLLAHK